MPPTEAEKKILIKTLKQFILYVNRNNRLPNKYNSSAIGIVFIWLNISELKYTLRTACVFARFELE